jgi:hypothetical protein
LNRRFCYWFLFASLIIALAFAAARPLRVSGAHHVIGVIQFAAIGFAAWRLGAHRVASDDQHLRLVAVAGIFLVTPFALVALLWVGLGPPWQATPAENQMRYLVLTTMSIGIVVGFAVLKEALVETGERFHSTIGVTAALLAGPLYLIWDAFMFGAFTSRLHDGALPPAFVDLDTTLDIILFVAGGLTYIAGAAFATSLGEVKWLGRGAARTFIIISLGALLLLVIRGLHFPDPQALSSPWYTNPGFVVGIPAIPFIVPFLFGVVLLRRAGGG